MFGFIRRRWAFAPTLIALLVCSAAWAQSDVSTMLRRADADARAGRYDAARSGYAQALSQGASLDQDAIRAELVARSYANTTPPDLAAAIRYFQSALRLSNGEERVRAELADTQVRAGKYDDAAEHYLALTKAHPESPIYMIALSRALLQAGRGEEALLQLQPWLIRTPGTTSVRLEYARILSYQKRFFDAKQQYDTVLKTEPTNLVAEIGLAKVTSWQGDQESALPMYERVLAHNPSNYDALVGKAFCLLWMGRESAALPLLETAIRRNPADADVREALSHISGASSLPPASAAPPSIADVPAAAPFIERETAAPSVQREAAQRITVPPTTLPEVTAAQRSAGAKAFAPKGSKQSSSAGKWTASKKPANSAKSEPEKSPQTEEDTEPKPEPNVFGFTGMSNGRIVVILTVIVGVLILLLFSVSSRDAVAIDRHDPRHSAPLPVTVQRVVKVSRPYREPTTNPELEAETAVVAEAPRMVAEAPVTPAPRRDARVAKARPAMVAGDYTLSGIPRQNEPEHPSRPDIIPRAQLRRDPPASVPAPPPRANVTEIMPRADVSMLLNDTKLKGLRVLLIGSEEKLVEFERVALESSGAEVVVEGNWSEAIHRMESAGVHAIVLNEGGGDHTRRIYQAVESQYPGWMKRLLLVLAGDDVPTQHFMATCQARCLMQPFQSGELVNTLGSMFGRNGTSGR